MKSHVSAEYWNAESQRHLMTQNPTDFQITAPTLQGYRHGVEHGRHVPAPDRALGLSARALLEAAFCGNGRRGWPLLPLAQMSSISGEIT